MARIFTDGAETGDLSLFANTTGITVTSTTPLNGTYSYNIANPGGILGFTPLSELYFRVRVKYFIGHSIYFSFKNNTSLLMTIEMDATNSRYNIFNNATGIRTYGTIGSVNLGISHLLEVYYKIDNTVGAINARVNGVSVVSISGVDTLQGANSTTDNIYFDTSYTSYVIYLDDLALNDTTGGVDNSWCGDGKILAFIPDGAGDSTQWTPSAGSNYQCVDELPPVNTDYVSTSTSTNIDNYTLSTYTMLSGESVNRVWATAIAKDTASAGTLKLGLKTVATNYTASKAIGTDFSRVNGTVHTVNPNTSAAWTQAQLDALQITLEMP